MNPDLFDGWRDNATTNQREYYQDGKLMRYVRRECLGGESTWREVRKPWGAFPDYPANQVRMQA